MITLARKYRPTILKDLLGQDALVTVIKAAMESGKLGQAYILTGVRGVGKTTTARIIARSVNCENGPHHHTLWNLPLLSGNFQRCLARCPRA